MVKNFRIKIFADGADLASIKKLNLKKYIFEPNDSITHIDIKNNINETIKRYIPNLIINDISFNNNEIEELIIVELTYTVTEGTFNSTDTVTLTF